MKRRKPAEVFLSHAAKDKGFVILSAHAIRSIWVKREVTYAMDESRFDERIIPVRIGQCNAKKLSWVLPQIQTIDFTSGFEKGCRQLLRVWGSPFKRTKTS